MMDDEISRLRMVAISLSNFGKMCIRDRGIILRLGITDDDVILCDEEGVGHFPLRRKALAGAGAVSYTHLDVYKRQVMN